MAIHYDPELIEEYAQKIEPILPLAKKAYGSKNRKTPNHEASREYTRLLSEFYQRGGNLPRLASRLNVAYAGMRRRVIMQDMVVSSYRQKKTVSDKDNIRDSAQRIRKARQRGIDDYHNQLAEEFKIGISLAKLAKELGLSSAAPLYYGVQRSLQRQK